MQLGIFAKTFTRPNLEEIWDAVSTHGLQSIQFNFSSAGLATLPQRIDSTLADRIRRELHTRGIKMAAVSGTFNLIHPDLTKRRFGLERLKTLASTCERLESPMVTLCTGTRDPDNMWRHHPDNQSQAAWDDLVASLTQALSIARQYNVNLGVEPEVGNVINNASRARTLLDQMKNPRLKIIMDPANLFPEGSLPRMKVILEEAFELLGSDIGLAHAKDLRSDGKAGDVAAGKGVLDYDLYLRLLESSQYHGPLILHGLTENEVPGCLQFLRSKMPVQGKLI